MSRSLASIGVVATSWLLVSQTPDELRAAPKARSSVRMRLIILPDAKRATKIIDAVTLKRLLVVLLKRYAVDVQIGPPMTATTFAAQVWRARAIGDRTKALAVVWFKSLSKPGTGKEAELFLHLVDRLTQKALVKTLRLRGRLGTDLHQTVALKLWTLLRASLLELRGTKRGTTSALMRIIGPPRTRPVAAAKPRAVTVIRKVYVPRPPAPARVRLGIGYVAGVFASGLAWHHGAWLSADVPLKRYPSRKLTVGLGAGVELLWPVELRAQGIDLRLELVPVTLGITLGWERRAFAMEGRLHTGVIVQQAEATAPGREPQSLWRGNPLVGVTLGAGWRPLRRLVVGLRLAVDGLLRGQCFETSNDDELCVDRARFSVGVAVMLALP